jgi:hypothetical protein
VPNPNGTVAPVFYWAGVNGTSYSSTPAFLSRSVRLTFSFSRWTWAPDARTAPMPGLVQRKVGAGIWRTLSKTTSSTPTLFNIRLRPFSLSPVAKNVTVSYRVKVPAGGIVRQGDVSPVIKVRYENSHRYTGFKLFLYKASRKYCPAATIHVTALRRGRAGEQPTGLYELRISPDVRSFSSAYKRSVVLHECGHFLQYKNYGSTMKGRALMLKQADRIYGTNHPSPMEHMADCISHAVEPHGYLGYGGRCTAKQIRYAWRILHGKKLY